MSSGMSSACAARARLGPLNDDGFARARMMRRFDDLAIDADVALGQKPLDGAAREIGQLAAQKDIQPLPRERHVNQMEGNRWIHFLLGPPLPIQMGLQGTEADLAAARPLAFSCSCFQERRISRPTPTQIALSAMLKAGKPISSPLRRLR
jgi:hypothetical protein